jgi:CheY-like chemotaxis protein
VLCIDGDAVSRQILVTALARPGFAIECVCDGQEALERFTRDAGGFDVLVTDHRLPRLDGLTLVRRLRECGFGGGFVVVSDSMNSRDRAAYRSFGVASFLTKPIEPVLLRAAVDAAVSALPGERSMTSAAKASRSPFPNHTSL